MKAISIGHTSKMAWGATAGFGKVEKGALFDSVWGVGLRQTVLKKTSKGWPREPSMCTSANHALQHVAGRMGTEIEAFRAHSAKSYAAQNAKCWKGPATFFPPK